MFNNSVFVLLSNLLLTIRGDISEFGLHELDDYNEMIRCLSAFKEDFIQCNHDIRRLAKTAYNVFPENSTLGKAFKCCGIWMVRDCWYKKAEESCPKNQLHLIHKMPHKLLPSLHEWCDDYRDDSFICRVPRFWPIILLSFVLIIMAFIISCVVCCVRRRKRSKSQDIEDIGSQSSAQKKRYNNNDINIDSDS